MITKPRAKIDIAEVERLAGLGLNREQIASALGIANSTLYKRQKECREFGEAIKRGKSKAVGAIANVLYEKALAGDNAAMIFYLKTQGGFIEAQKQIIAEDKEASSGGLSDLYARMSKANKQ